MKYIHLWFTSDLLIFPTTFVSTNSNHPQFCDFKNSWGWAVWRMKTLPTWNLHGRRCGLGFGIGIRELLGPHTDGGSFFFFWTAGIARFGTVKNHQSWNSWSARSWSVSSFLCLSWDHEFLSSFFRSLFSRICSTSRPHRKGWFQCWVVYLMLRSTISVNAFWLFSSMNSCCNRIKGERAFPNPTFSLRSPLWWCETCPTSTPSRCCHETQLWSETFGICSLWCHLPWDWNATKDDLPSTN